MKKRKLIKVFGILSVAAMLQAGIIYAEPVATEATGEPAFLDADTVEYDMRTGIATATGDVLMKRGISKVTGAKAVYNTNTQAGMVEGNVIAVRGDTRITCDKATSDGQEHMMATGNVHGVQLDKTFDGEQVDYFPKQNEYVLIENGGKLTSKDGVFTADRIEGWLTDEHYIGTGHAHLVSPPKDLEAVGDRVDYYGKEEGKAILMGNAWVVQGNNTVKGNRLTIYLAKEGNAKVE